MFSLNLLNAIGGNDDSEIKAYLDYFLAKKVVYMYYDRIHKK